MLKLFKKRGKQEAKAELKKLLDGYELPAFSKAALRVLSLLRDSSSPTSEITAAIEMDPGINVKVLQTVNSAAYGAFAADRKSEEVDVRVEAPGAVRSGRRDEKARVGGVEGRLWMRECAAIRIGVRSGSVPIMRSGTVKREKQSDGG